MSKVGVRSRARGQTFAELERQRWGRGLCCCCFSTISAKFCPQAAEGLRRRQRRSFSGARTSIVHVLVHRSDGEREDEDDGRRH